MTRDDLKPAIRDTLDLIRAGRVIVSIDHDRQCGYLEEVNERPVSEKMLMPGVWTLFQAGFLDRFGFPVKPPSPSPA